MKSVAFPKREKKDAPRRYSASYYLLWHECLRLSPSYQLAHEVATGLRSYKKGDGQPYPKDFPRVLAVYKDLGSIYDCTRKEWRDRNMRHFTGVRSDALRLREIGRLRAAKNSAYSDLKAKIQRYIDSDWETEGRPTFTVLALPSGLPTTSAVKQLRKILAKGRAKQAPRSNAARYGLAAPRVQYRTILQYLKLISFRALFNEKPLWQLAGYTKLSPTHSYHLDLDSDASPFNRVERNTLTAMASRALRNAHYLVENSARGKFPSSEKCLHAVPQDFPSLMARIANNT